VVRGALPGGGGRGVPVCVHEIETQASTDDRNVLNGRKRDWSSHGIQEVSNRGSPFWRKGPPSRYMVGFSRTAPTWTPASFTPPKDTLVPNATWAVPRTFSSTMKIQLTSAPGFTPLP